MADGTTDYYSSPDLMQAQNEAATAGTTATNYMSAASLLPQKLREAVMAKVDYNKDIITEKNQAQANYFAAPSAARAKYNDPNSANYVFNPFQAEKLVGESRSQAYEPYATLTDILGARTGSLADIINAGTGAFNADVTAKQGAYQNTSDKYNRLFGVAEARTNRDAAANAAKYQNDQFQQQLALDTYKAMNPSSSGGGGSSVPDLSWIAELLNGGNTDSGPTEPKPAQKPAGRFVSQASPGGQWMWDAVSNDWVPMVD